MAKEKGNECLNTGMGNTCKSLMGLVLLVAGGAFVSGELGVFASGALLGGGLIALTGLSMLVHACGLCSMCKC